jgi:uncharacterized cupredoxin-like copper-binding protein
MRKWKQGVIALLIFFVAVALMTATENLTLRTVSLFAMFFSILYAVGLVLFFIFQPIHGWAKKRWAKLKIEEKVVKTKIVTIYECSHCKMQYSDSSICPNCGSPHRKTIEKTEEEKIEKWKTV